MPSLAPKDRFLLEAAHGWLLLSNPVEALLELDQISPASSELPEVLMTLWDIHAYSRRWEAAIEVADRLILQIEDQPEGYIKRAYALHELKRTVEAWGTLHPASERFDDSWLIPYNLACYAAQLGRATEAIDYFRRALRRGDRRELRSLALDDPDLQSIRSNIEKLTAQ